MPQVKEQLKNLVARFKKVQIPEPESLRRLKEVQEAAKSVSREVKAGKE